MASEQERRDVIAFVDASLDLACKDQKRLREVVDEILFLGDDGQTRLTTYSPQELLKEVS